MRCFWVHPDTSKSRLAQAVAHGAVRQGNPVLYRKTRTLLQKIGEASEDRTRKYQMELLATLPVVVINDLGMRKLASTAVEELPEIVTRRHQRVGTLLTFNHHRDEWGNLLGDGA